MEAIETRSKKEIAREIDANRRETTRALRDTKEALTVRNPAVLAWKATKSKAAVTKDKTVAKAQQADAKIRMNIYSALGIAMGVGAVTGFLMKRKRAKAKAKAKMRCCE
jgi:ElaB/YqjD/DUF883 family membrane-anchored ribosome-binding protein